MSTRDDILSEMDALLNSLVGNARQLNEASAQVISEEILAPLQDKQQELIDTLVQLNTSLQQGTEQETPITESPIWNEIQKKLETFQELNSSFIDNLRVRKGLIGFEVKDLKKRRRQLAQLKAVYGHKKMRKKPPSRKHKSRINTVQ